MPDSAHETPLGAAPSETPGTAKPLRSRRTRFAWLFAAIPIVAVVAGVLWFKHGEPTASGAEPPASRDVPYLDGTFIRFSAGFAERAKIQLVQVQEGQLSPMVTVTGTVTFDPRTSASVGARIPGRVRNVRKVEGDQVNAGDVLAEIESAELGKAQADVISARAHLDAALANERREKALAAQQVSTPRDAELATATATAARADVIAADQRVKALGGSVGGETGVLLLTSPIPGRIIERGVSRGQSVEPSHTAFRVADPDHLWIDLSVFERDIGAIHVGDPVDVSPQVDPGTVARGTISYVGDAIDLASRTAPVRVIFEHVNIALRPGQSVLAKIHTPVNPTPRMLVPRTAVTSIDGKPTVFLSHDATCVEPRAVELGAQDGDRVEVASGLKVGERIVNTGIFELKSEIFR